MLGQVKSCCCLHMHTSFLFQRDKLFVTSFLLPEQADLCAAHNLLAPDSDWLSPPDVTDYWPSFDPEADEAESDLDTQYMTLMGPGVPVSLTCLPPPQVMSAPPLSELNLPSLFPRHLLPTPPPTPQSHTRLLFSNSPYLSPPSICCPRHYPPTPPRSPKGSTKHAAVVSGKASCLPLTFLVNGLGLGRGLAFHPSKGAFMLRAGSENQDVLLLYYLFYLLPLAFSV